MLASAEPLIDRLWRSETEGADTTTPERRAAVLVRLDAYAAEVKHPDLQRFYRQELRDRFYALFRRERTPWVKTPWVKGAPLRPVSPGVLRAGRPDMRSAMVAQVLIACLVRPALIDAGFERLAALRLDGDNAVLLAALLDLATTAPDSTPADLRAALPPTAAAAADALVAAHRPGIGTLAFARPETPLTDAHDQFANFLDALLADVRVGDDIAATNAHFRVSLTEADFAAVRRNHKARAELSDSERVVGQANRQPAAEERGGAVGIVVRTE